MKTYIWNSSVCTIWIRAACEYWVTISRLYTTWLTIIDTYIHTCITCIVYLNINCSANDFCLVENMLHFSSQGYSYTLQLHKPSLEYTASAHIWCKATSLLPKTRGGRPHQRSHARLSRSLIVAAVWLQYGLSDTSLARFRVQSCIRVQQ